MPAPSHSLSESPPGLSAGAAPEMAPDGSFGVGVFRIRELNGAVLLLLDRLGSPLLSNTDAHVSDDDALDVIFVMSRPAVEAWEALQAGFPAFRKKVSAMAADIPAALFPQLGAAINMQVKRFGERHQESFSPTPLPLSEATIGLLAKIGVNITANGPASRSTKAPYKAAVANLLAKVGVKFQRGQTGLSFTKEMEAVFVICHPAPEVARLLARGRRDFERATIAFAETLAVSRLAAISDMVAANRPA